MNPVDLAAHGRWLAVVGYTPRSHVVLRYDLQAQELDFGERFGNALQPRFSDRYLFWAEQRGSDPWALRFEELPE